MKPRTISAAVLLACAVAFAGCATPPSDASAPTATTAPPPATSSPEPTESAAGSTPEASDSPAITAAGAYLDFTDGAIEATPGPKALFFHASWCPKCRALDEELRSSGAPDGLTVFKVDYDARTDLRQKYGVTLQTTVVFVDDDGELISSTVLYDDPSIASLIAAMP